MTPKLVTANLKEPSFDAGDIAEAVNDLSQVFVLADRAMRVWWMRTMGLGKPPTVRAIGQSMGLTGARIQQIEVRGASAARDPLRKLSNGAVGRLADALEERIGAAFPLAELHWPEIGVDPMSLAVEASMESPDPLSQLGLFLVRQRGYRVSGSWLIKGEDPLGDLIEALKGCYPSYPNIHEAGKLADELRIRPLAFQYFVEEDAAIKVIENKVCPWPPTAAARAEVMLRVYGVPLNKEQIARAIGRHPGTVINLLTSSERFSRIDFDMVALTEWGIPEFRGIIPAMKEAIAARGGMASRQQISKDLLSTYPISTKSIDVYLGTHHFIRVGKGLYRVRGEGEEVSVAEWTEPEAVKNAFWRNGCWRVRLDVDGNRIRGSGGPIPRFFASLMSVGAGDSKSVPIHADGVAIGSTRVSWPSQMPTIGSLSSSVRYLGLQVGDSLFLEWDAKRGCISIEGARTPTCNEQTEACVRAQVAARIGYPAVGDSVEALTSLSSALGFEPGVERGYLVARLRKRQDEALLGYFRVLHDLGTLRSQERVEAEDKVRGRPDVLRTPN